MNLYRVYTYRYGKVTQCFINAKSVEDAKDKTWWLPEDDRYGKVAFKCMNPAKVGVDKAQALEEYYKSYTRYINGNSKVVIDWGYIPMPKQEIAIKKMLELMKDNYKIKGGYFTTAIKGYHEPNLFFKKN